VNAAPETAAGKAAGGGNAAIIIKKVKKRGHDGHHGGAWKVAYADFVTAMMAFFLLLWLLNATTEEQKRAISNYFAPEAPSYTKSGSGGVLGGHVLSEDGGATANSGGGGIVIPVPRAPRADDPTTEEDRNKPAGHEAQDGEEPEEIGDDDAAAVAQAPGNETVPPQGEAPPTERATTTAEATTQIPGEAGQPVPGLLAQDGRATQGAEPGSPGEVDGKAPEAERQPAATSEDLGKAAAADPGRQQATAGEDRPETPTKADERRARELQRQMEERTFTRIEQSLREAMEASPELSRMADNLLIDRTAEGLRIQLIDQDRLAMFPLGSAKMHDHTRRLLAKMAAITLRLKNKIAVTGHTDATPYVNDVNYGNWELSTDRANASRRALLEAGLASDRFARVVGKADQEPLLPDDPTNPRNRRISIVILRDREPLGQSGR